MPSRIALATLALGTGLLALPAFAQTYGGSDSSAQQYKYPIGRSADEGGPNYGPQSTAQTPQRTSAAENRQARATGAYQPQRRTYREAQYGEGRPDQGYYNYAGGPGFAPTAGMDRDAIAWCEARFRSFDPATGTYLGFDGVRHSCP